jgi:RND family efflux transporter MFP subunit
MPVVEFVEFTGTTQAVQRVELRSRVNGYLKEIRFDDGARVEKDQILFVIEQEPFEVELVSAKAALEKAKANADLARSQLSRSERLAATNAVSREELDVQIAQKNSAEAEVGAAEASVERASLNLSHTLIRAPFAGRIGRHLVDVGNLVQAETTQLAVLEATDPIYVYFNISERDLLRFMEMVRRKLVPDPDEQPPTLYLGLANETGFPHEGRLDFRDLSVDPETGTILRRGVFPNSDGQLVPGLFARIKIPIGRPAPKLTIEERAVASDQRGDYVLVVDDQGLVEYRPVRLGVAEGRRRVVEEGLRADDWLIVNGLQRARPGAQVRAVRVEPEAPPDDHAEAPPADPLQVPDSRQEPRG